MVSEHRRTLETGLRRRPHTHGRPNDFKRRRDPIETSNLVPMLGTWRKAAISEQSLRPRLHASQAKADQRPSWNARSRTPRTSKDSRTLSTNLLLAKNTERNRPICAQLSHLPTILNSATCLIWHSKTPLRFWGGVEECVNEFRDRPPLVKRIQRDPKCNVSPYENASLNFVQR